MSCLVDTNVLSQTVKPEPNIAVMNWWSQQSVSDLSISAITIHELRYGFELLPMGKKRRRLEAWLADRVLPVFRGRIIPLDDEIADLSGRLLADARLSGHTADVSDAMIAATVRTKGLKPATLNQKHFSHFKVDLVEFSFIAQEKAAITGGLLVIR